MTVPGSGSKIGLLPGTFDPVHQGHVELATAARRALGLDEVWFLVNAQPWHKAGVSSYEHRLAMVKLAVSGQPGLLVYEGPLWNRPQTIAMFLELMRQAPVAEFVVVVGMDNLARLDTWKDWQSVVANTTYAAAHRFGTGDAELEALRRRLGPLGRELKVQLFDFKDYGTVSSTGIRRELAAGRQPQALPPLVYDYIVEQGLYRAPRHSA